MTSSNPFLKLKARGLMLGFFLIATTLALIFGVLGAFNILPLQPEDPVFAPILYMLIFCGLCLGVLFRSRSILQIRYLIGEWPHEMHPGRLLLLVVGMFLFSLGLFHVSYLLLSVIAPTFVELTLQQTLLLSSDEAAAPGLYNALMLLSALVVAPITEEFLFRGILLHRWGVKWGTRPAIILTSVIFGVLHSNLIGLFFFGVVMSLLYLQSRCLWVPIAAHALNNAIASGLEFLINRSHDDISVDTLAEFRSSWWLGIFCLLISGPWLGRYILRNWPRPRAGLPYLANQGSE